MRFRVFRDQKFESVKVEPGTVLHTLQDFSEDDNLK